MNVLWIGSAGSLKGLLFLLIFNSYIKQDITAIVCLFCNTGLLCRNVSDDIAYGRCLFVIAHAVHPKPIKTVVMYMSESVTDENVLYQINSILCRFYSAPQCWHCKRCISYNNSVRPSVCPSVTRRYCVKTTAHSTVRVAPSDRKMCLVL